MAFILARSRAPLWALWAISNLKKDSPLIVKIAIAVCGHWLVANFESFQPINRSSASANGLCKIHRILNEKNFTVLADFRAPEVQRDVMKFLFVLSI